MPRYLLRFRVESCLTHGENLEVPCGEHRATFLFSRKRAEDKHVWAQVELEARNNRLAELLASSKVLPPVLDVLSFATGTPLLLRECNLILKDQAGSPTRCAIYVGDRRTRLRVPLSAEAIKDANQILSSKEAPRLPLCWHRYALDRQLALEQFVFEWLALEGLAGDADIPTRCPKCRQVLQHCEVEVTHRGSSKTVARDIFLAANPAIASKEFDERIWRKARNYIFHGRKYPEPEYLAELKTLTAMLSKAAEKQVRKEFGLEERGGTRRPYEEVNLVCFFIEWTTGNPILRYAADCPEQILEQLTKEAPGAIAAALKRGINSLDYNTQSPDW